jgi:hypothetical protein
MLLEIRINLLMLEKKIILLKFLEKIILEKNFPVDIAKIKIFKGEILKTINEIIKILKK